MTWTSEQMQNAATIIQVGRSMGASTRDIQTALAAALVESDLINVNHGDRDSLGLFQQRPSQGWGTPEQVTNPAYAAGKFFKALMGLGDKRYGMSIGAAAQAVQRSAYPGRYDQRVGEVRSMWPAAQKAAGIDVKTVDGNPYPVQPNQPDPATMYGTTQVAQQNGQLSVGTPDAATMLGAWGLNSPQPLSMTDGTKTILSPATNQQIIAPLQQVSQPYAKGTDAWRRTVVDTAKSALGTPYVWGGTNLQSGVDCSGLVQQAFAKAGIELPRISYQQANYGQRVGYGGLQPGDLVAWDNSPRNPGADHISIYLGNGLIIEAPRPGLAVRIRKIGQNLDGGYGVHIERK